MIGDEEQDQREERQRHEHPRGLGDGVGAGHLAIVGLCPQLIGDVEPVDHHQAHEVDHRGHWVEDRVSVGRQAADHDVPGQ